MHAVTSDRFRVQKRMIEKRTIMSESMNAQKNENLVALVIFSCLMLLKICILVALFAVYSEHEANPIENNLAIKVIYNYKK